jgi:hypothetical protein
MDTNIIDIRGKELHFIKHILNRQQTRNISDVLTLEALLSPRGQSQWGEDFIYRLEREGLLRFEDGRVYATDLSIRSIKEKYIRESRLIEAYIIDDFEYAFLMFMNNRNEPVHMFDFPSNFKYHSKIDGQPVPGTTNAFYNWMTEIDMYVHDPTIDGYILNDTGKMRFEKLRKEKEFKAQNERLDIEVKRQTIEGAKFSRNVAYASLGVAALTAFVPLFIWLVDKDKTQKTQTEIPQLKEVIQTQSQIQQTLQDIQKTVYSFDTSGKRVKIVK